MRGCARISDPVSRCSLGNTLQNKQKDDIGFASAAVMGIMVRALCGTRCFAHSLAPLTRRNRTQGATLLAKGYQLDEEEVKLT